MQFVLTPLWALVETDLLTGDPEAARVRCEEALALAVETGERALLIPFVVTGTRRSSRHGARTMRSPGSPGSGNTSTGGSL